MTNRKHVTGAAMPARTVELYPELGEQIESPPEKEDRRPDLKAAHQRYNSAAKLKTVVDDEVPLMRPRSHRSLSPEIDKLSRSPKVPPHQEIVSQLRMRRAVLDQIRATIGSRKAETGGMLVGNAETYEVTHFIFDEGARTSGAIYYPDTMYLNRRLEQLPGEFLGIVHSHPPGMRSLSEGDRQAAWSNLTSPKNPHLQAYLMPLVSHTIPDAGFFEFIPFVVTCHPHGHGRVVVRQVPLELTTEGGVR